MNHSSRNLKRESQQVLRPQYPADSDKSHVEFILVASFDIDRGSVMEHQYPGPISGNEHMLAELMLPDQAHNRSQDWTIFFLHKDTPSEGDPDHLPNKERKGRKRPFTAALNAEELIDSGASTESEEEEGDSAIEGPPLIYVLNLVNTKHDSTVKRYEGTIHLLSTYFD